MRYCACKARQIRLIHNRHHMARSLRRPGTARRDIMRFYYNVKTNGNLLELHTGADNDRESVARGDSRKTLKRAIRPDLLPVDILAFTISGWIDNIKSYKMENVGKTFDQL